MKNLPLQFAKDITNKVNESWNNGEFLNSVTPTTYELLTYWFSENHTQIREINFHEGQRQAILNIIYLHEVLKAPNIFSCYKSISPDLLIDGSLDLESLSKEKYSHPKYCVKMATGTGKTWVLSALLTWQYLNAKNGEDGNFSKNFLIVSPGLIVYERLLDAFIGKENEENNERNFNTSDFYQLQELFLPEQYRQEMFGFLQSSLVKKEDIGKKVTGDGMIAITNWHLLAGVEGKDNVLDVNDPSRIIKSIARPGKSSGNDLNVLDSPSEGEVLNFLKSINDLVVFNDEAHHIHEVKRMGEVVEVEWQKSLTYISESKKNKFIQIDFSATPYNQVGTEKIFFPHIVVNFDLENAIKKGFVKTLVLDKRKEIATMELGFKAERDENNSIIGLSEGQRIMLRAGLKKLRILEDSFGEISDKHPKMLIVCEETEVVSYVTEFLKSEGLDTEDIIEIHSNKKGEVGQEEWQNIKNKLFHLDKNKKPKVVISVLMLREGFDVNNICVIVPLRSSQSGILLEQTIGRGLRLMWREPEFKEEKDENRHILLNKKMNPINYLDILSIVEHPNFIKFYDELMKEIPVGMDDRDIELGDNLVGDIITLGLKKDFEEYDFSFPIIIREAEEVLKDQELSFQNSSSLNLPLEELKKLIGKGEHFISEEVTSGVRFGDYSIQNGVISATSYNDYIARLVNRVSVLINDPISRKAHPKESVKYPMIQVNFSRLANVIDDYIRNNLFGKKFNPFEDENWRVLLIDYVSNYIIKQCSRLIINMQEVDVIETSEVILKKISEINKIRVNEKYSIDTSKTIYEKTPFPSNRGGFEKDFIGFADNCSSVKSFVKIIPHVHGFIRLRYIKDDGLIHYYYPDFLLRTENNEIYMIETKGDDQMIHPNVLKKKNSALYWINKVNNLSSEKRDNAKWNYVLLDQSLFDDWRRKGATMQEILDFAKLRIQKEAKGLF